MLVDSPDEGWVEDAWLGHSLRLGDALLWPTQGCVRCTRVTREQSGLESDRDVFRTMARHHGGRFGAWCDVLVPGVVALGQEAMVGS